MGGVSCGVICSGHGLSNYFVDRPDDREDTVGLLDCSFAQHSCVEVRTTFKDRRHGLDCRPSGACPPMPL